MVMVFVGIVFVAAMVFVAWWDISRALQDIRTTLFGIANADVREKKRA